MNFIKGALFTIWEPDFLEEDDFWLEFAEKLGQVESVSPDSFNIEG